MKRDYNITPTTNPSLEYAAILSGLSMGGNFIEEKDILQARQVHTKNYGENIGFNFALPSGSARR